jgi:hypothetical protein
VQDLPPGHVDHPGSHAEGALGLLQELKQASQGWWEDEDNTISRHRKDRDATTRYFRSAYPCALELLQELKTLATQFRDRGFEGYCPFCPELNPDMKHIMCRCNHHGATLIMERHNRIGSAVLKAIKEGRSHVEVWEDKRVNQYPSTFAHRSGVKRPDLMYDSAYVKKGKKKKVINLCEITSPWPWIKSMEESHSEKVKKYAELRTHLEQEFPEVEVTQRTIAVSPTGCRLRKSQKEFAAATAPRGNRPAPHQRNIVDVALRAVYEHYQSFVQHLMKAENVR